MKRFSFSLIIYFLISFCSLSCNEKAGFISSTPDPTLAPEEVLNTTLLRVLEETEVPGFTISIVKNGRLAFQESFGMANIDLGQAFTNQTTMPIGSISKTFIGAALMKAIEEAYFTLETPINDLLPFDIINPKSPTALIKIKHLASHTSSLIDQEDYYNEAYYILPSENLSTAGAQLMLDHFNIQQREGRDLEEFIREYYLPDGEFFSEDNFGNDLPGQVFQYSNIASSLAAYLIESVTGQSFQPMLPKKYFSLYRWTKPAIRQVH